MTRMGAIRLLIVAGVAARYAYVPSWRQVHEDWRDLDMGRKMVAR